jgi:hypothetical protein
MAPDSIDAVGGKGDRDTPSWRLAMGIEYDRLGVLFRLGGLLRAAENGSPGNALPQGESPHRHDDVLRLLDENAGFEDWRSGYGTSSETSLRRRQPPARRMGGAGHPTLRADPASSLRGSFQSGRMKWQV